MKPNMIVTPAIDSDFAGSLAGFQTPMLLLGRYQDGGIGPVQFFDEKTNGSLSRLLLQRNFTGRLGNRFTFENKARTANQHYLLVVGLGAGADFSCVSIAKIVGIAIHKAIKKGCTRVSIPFFPNRFASGLSLKSQAQFTHEAAVVKLREYAGDDELTIELVCVKTGSAARDLQAGLELPLTGRICCKHVDGMKCA